jgi:hypothetical protein
MTQVFKHRAVLIISLLTLFLLTATVVPITLHQGFYTLSLFIKDIMLWLLPLTVGSFIASTIVGFEKKAALFVGTLVVFEAVSNFTSVMFAYLAAGSVSDIVPEAMIGKQSVQFLPLWKLPLSRPSFWSADKGTMLGLILGALALTFNHEPLKNWISKWKDLSNWILTKVFSPLIPLFILGFFARIYHTGLIKDLSSKYTLVVMWLCMFLITYILALVVLASDFTLRGFFKTLKNLGPAGAIAFSSGCSLSTMPWTINGASKNLKNPSFAQSIIPATTNIQQIGDCIANTFLCFLIYKHFFGHAPSLSIWLSFAVMFTLARFTTAAVLGGAILIMIPVYEKYLGFNSEMVAIILAFNVLLDPIITSSNVLANGALCSVFEKLWLKVTGLKKQES